MLLMWCGANIGDGGGMEDLEEVQDVLTGEQQGFHH